MMKSEKHLILKKTLAMLLSVIMLFMQLPMGVLAIGAEVEEVEPVTVLALGESVTVEGETLYSFTPEESGVYRIYSSGSCDSIATLYDENMVEIARNDDGGSNMNFEINYSMTAGTTYYLRAGAYIDGIFTYVMTVEESEYESIEIVSLPTLEVTEYDFEIGYWMSVYNEQIVDRYFQYTPHDALREAVIRVNYKDGRSEEVPFYDENEMNTGISWDWDFYTNPWKVGEDNHYYVTYKGMKVLANATVLESPVSKIEVVSMDIPEIIEYDTLYGYWSDIYMGMLKVEEKYFTYEPPIDPSSVEFKVTYKDGTVENVRLMGENGESENQFITYYDQYKNPWTIGGKNEFEIWYKGAYTTHSVTIVETPVESIRVVEGGSFEYSEYDEKYGYWMDQEHFYYSPSHFVDDIVIEATYKDGSVERIPYRNEDTGIVNFSYSNNQYEKPWVVGDDNEVTISYKAVSTTAYVTVKPGLVESIEIEDVTVLEGVQGSFWQETLPDGSTDVWFNYEVFAEEVTVSLTDGTTIHGTEHEVEEQLGCDIQLYYEQNYYNQWDVGEYTVTASVMGKRTEFLFIIRESNIESVSVEDMEIEEFASGYYESGYWDPNTGNWIDAEWFKYHPVNNAQITVTFKDGTVFTGTVFEFGPNYDYNYSCTTNQSYVNQWKAGETYTAKFIICGKTAEFSVSITENKIQSIEVIDTQNFKYYENDTSHGSWHGDFFRYETWALASRITLRVTYKDGSVEEIPYYDEFGNYSGISFEDTQNETPWTIGGENIVTIIYKGARTNISAVIEVFPIESVVIEPLIHIEHTNGDWQYYSDINTYYFHYYLSPQNITVNFNDGRVISGSVWDIEKQLGIGIEYSSDQNYDTPWGIGDHTASLLIMGKWFEYTVTIVESDVESISVAEPYRTCTEGTNGYWQIDYNDHDTKSYYYWYYAEPGEITVTYKDGTTITGTIYEIEDQTGYMPKILHRQGNQNQWGVGVHSVEIDFMGATCSFDVEITPSPIESIEVDDISVNQYTDGRWQFGEGENYYYYSAYPDNVTVTYKDGTVISGTPNYIYEQTGYNISVITDQNYYNQWGIGTYTAIAALTGVSCEYEVTIAPSNIESVTIEPITHMEYTGGSWHSEGDYDEEGNWVEIGTYYNYRVTPQMITITYNDGTVVSGSIEDIYKLTGEYLSYSCEQDYYNQWGIGSYTVSFELMGKTGEYTVNIIESNVESVTIAKKTYVEGTGGWWCEERLDDGTYGFYYEYSFDIDEMTITYKDGSFVTGTSDEIADITGYYPDYDLHFDYYNQWGVGVHTVPVTYMGKQYQAEVEITPSPVERIEVEPVTIIENTNGYWTYEGYYDENDNYFECRYFQYNVVPQNITVIYTDGRVLETTPGDLGQQTGEYISVCSSQSADDQWGIGTHTTTVGYMGKTAELEVTIEPTPVESIIVEPLVMDEGMNDGWSGNDEDGYSPWYDYSPQNITVNFLDGTQVTGTYDELCSKFNGAVYYESTYNDREHSYRPVGNYKGTVTVLGFSAEYDIIIEEYKIESVTVLPKILVANQDGSYNYGYNDPTTGEWIEGEWFWYSIEQLTLIVKFKDGTSFCGTTGELSSMGYSTIVNHDQSYFNQWSTGKHAATLQFYNFEVPFDVEIVEKTLGENNDYSYGVMSDGTAILYSYNGSLNMTIPETIDGYTITALGDYLFWGSGIESITIPSTVRYIDRFAFYSCSNLKTVRFYDSLEVIASNAFNFCDSLSNVVVVGSKENAENIHIGTNNDCLLNAAWNYTADCVEHEYDDACDEDCNICHATREDAHAYEWVVDSEATCVDDGWKHEECTLCGASRNYNTVIEAKGEHENVELLNYEPATCGRWGYTGDLYCHDCGTYVETGESIEPTGNHTNTDIVGEMDATCGSEGYTGDVYCYDCDTILALGETIPKTEHKNTERVGYVEATCGQMGYTGDLYCKDCQTVIAWGEEIAATECYKNTEIQGKIDATCGKEGYTGDLVCLDCGNVIEKGEIIPATGEHKNTYRDGVSEASCCYSGYTGDLICGDCGSVVAHGESIPATGEHKSTYRKGARPATCGQNGRTGELVCEESGRILERSEIIPATGNHGELTIANASNPTCSTPGYTGDVVCSVCGVVMQSGEPISATGKHIYDNDYDTNCNSCGEYREVTLAPATLSLIGGVVNQGDTIRVDVRIDGNTGFAGLQFGLLYDNTYFTLKDVESQMEDFFVTIGNSIVFDSYKNHVSDGVIATLVFEVSENAPVGDYNLQLRFMSGSTENFEAVLMTNATATITVESAIAGDVNGDGALNITDLVMLRRYLAAMDPVTMTSEIAVKKGADANNDGIIDAIDLAFLRQALAAMSIG